MQSFSRAFLSAVFILASVMLWSCRKNIDSDGINFQKARDNGILANEGFLRCLDYTRAWLEYADSSTGLFPENLYNGNDTWNAHNSAADNYPFMVLTSLLLDPEMYASTMHEILHIPGDQCGNEIGAKFWEVVCTKHGINPIGTYCGDIDTQLKHVNIYYNKASYGWYVLHAVLMDLEHGTMDIIHNNPYE